MKEVYYLVEDFNPSMDYTSAEVVSVSPWASYQLEKSGVKYRLLEDYYSTREMIKDQDEFVLEELECHNRLDEYLRQNISFCKETNIFPVRAHHSRLTYLTNTVIIQAYMVTNFISKASPEKIIYVYRADDEKRGDFSIYTFQSRALRTIRHILESYCEQNQNIAFEVREFQDIASPAKRQSSRGNVEWLSGLERHRDIFKNIYHIFKYAKLRRYLQAAKKLRSTNILFLNAGSKRMDYLVKKFIQNSARVFIKDGDDIFLASSLSGQKVKDNPQKEGDSDNIREECLDASLKIDSQTDFYRWVNNKCGFDVNNIIAPYMEDFVKNICADFLNETRMFMDFLKKEKIDCTVSNAGVGKNVAAPLAAGKVVADTKNICFQHSCTVLDLKTRYVFDELNMFDYYFTTDDLSEGYFKGYLNIPYVDRCEIRQYPYYFSDIINRKPNRHTRKRREKVVYVTKKLAQGRMRFKSDGVILYPLAWYYEFQKRIVELFGKRDDFDFVYKHTPAQDWADRSIIPYIKDRGYKNIFIETRHFSECLGFADRVILDYSSTGFFEAVRAGVPVMSLYSDLSEIWQPYKAHFGKTLQKFSTIDDAIKKIDMFLNDNPKDYICNIPLSDTDIVDILLEIKKKQYG